MQPVFEVQRLSYRYPDGRLALEDVSFKIMLGEKVALAGANGAGKSTLLLHLNGILRGEGEIYVQGIHLSPQTVRTIRAGVGLVFQDADDQLFSATVYDDVSFGPLYMGLAQSQVRERVEQALKTVGMTGFETRVPYRLSAGEKKRVAIASVLSMDPESLIFDEPTAGMDPRCRREFIDLLSLLKQTLFIA
ncbi:MAG: ABC transporter ATP-binding protein, partial [Anaerolineaceae bacterium]|nr:ABC transporter ATP-binding protein [Anaerolineaceae bacterium]